MKRVRLAVVGVGHLGSIHARLASRADEIELVAVVDPDPTQCGKVAAETNARPVPDYRSLIGEIDAAVIATPTSTHTAVASELLRAGIHCLVEKPIAPTSVEADQLVKTARRSQTVLQVGHVERFNPALSAVRSCLSDPKYIEARRHSGFPFRSTDVGVVLDLMIHDIDVVLSLVRAPVVRVDALGAAVLSQHEDLVSARLQFASGAIAHLTASRVSYQPERTMQVFTARRFATVDFATREATLIEPGEEVLRREVDFTHASNVDADVLRDRLFTDYLVKKSLPVAETNAIEQEQRDFAQAIATGRQPEVSGVDGRDAVAVAEQILEQVAAHQWDGTADGRVGATPLLPATLPFDAQEAPRRKAG